MLVSSHVQEASAPLWLLYLIVEDTTEGVL